MQKDKTEETNQQDLAGRPHEIREQCSVFPYGLRLDHLLAL